MFPPLGLASPLIFLLMALGLWRATRPGNDRLMLAVLVAAAGTALGFPIIDPIIGLLIGVAILFITRDATLHIWYRLMDAVDPARFLERRLRRGQRPPPLHLPRAGLRGEPRVLA